MKKYICIGMIMLLLTGCGTAATFETLGDEYLPADPAAHRSVALELPEEAAAVASSSQLGQMYLCDGYDLLIQTMPSGNIDGTIRAVSGFDREDLTVIRVKTGDADRYEFVWTAAGESGDQVGRAVVLDDGYYHYVLTAMAAAAKAGSLHNQWDGIFRSFSLEDQTPES